MQDIAPSTLSLIQQVVVSLVAVAAAVFAATWSKSPVQLPLPGSELNRWLRILPIIAAGVIIGTLSTWLTDCSYLRLLWILIITAFLLCATLLLIHHNLLQKRPDISTLLVLVCWGWSILGTLTLSSVATMIIANQRMEDAYKKRPLTLSQFVGGQKQLPEGPIYLTAGLFAHFQAEMDECHNTTPEMNLYPPDIGQLKNGTYSAPKLIEEEQQVTITARSITHQESKTATIILLPDSPDIKRVQYPGSDNHNRAAIFDFIIISKNDSWVFGSEDFVMRNRLDTSEELNDPPQKTSVCQPIMDLAGSYAFDPYADVITIGTASREGTQIEENNRADRRGRKIAEWINLALDNAGKKKHVYTMNLGQYVRQAREHRVPTRDETAQERPVIIIGVVRQGEIDLKEALHNVFEQNQNNEFFRFLATHYPGRDIYSYNKIPKVACPTQ